MLRLEYSLEQNNTETIQFCRFRVSKFFAFLVSISFMSCNSIQASTSLCNRSVTPPLYFDSSQVSIRHLVGEFSQRECGQIIFVGF